MKVVGIFEEEHETREGFADVAEIVVGVPDALARMKRAGFLEVDRRHHRRGQADQLFEQYRGDGDPPRAVAVRARDGG